MYLKVEHQTGTYHWFFAGEDRPFFAYRYVLRVFEMLKLPAPTAFKVMKQQGAGDLTLTVLPPHDDGKSVVALWDAPMEQWTVLASEEAQLRLGVPKHMVDAQKVLSEAWLAQEWARLPGKD